MLFLWRKSARRLKLVPILKENNREIVAGQVVPLMLEGAMCMLDPHSTTPLRLVLYQCQPSPPPCYLWIWLLAPPPSLPHAARMSFNDTRRTWWICYHPNLATVNLKAIYPKSREDCAPCWRFKPLDLFFFVSMLTSLQLRYTLFPPSIIICICLAAIDVVKNGFFFFFFLTSYPTPSSPKHTHTCTTLHLLLYFSVSFLFAFVPFGHVDQWKSNPLICLRMPYLSVLYSH